MLCLACCLVQEINMEMILRCVKVAQCLCMFRKESLYVNYRELTVMRS